MPKKHATESDEVRLKKKIAERVAKPSHPEGDCRYAVIAQAAQARATKTACGGPEKEACGRCQAGRSARSGSWITKRGLSQPEAEAVSVEGIRDYG